MCNEIDKGNRNFSRNNNKEMDTRNIQCTIETIAWDNICRLESQGGFGIKKTENVTQPDNIWVQSTKTNYLKNNSNFLQINKTSTTSTT